MRSSWHLIYVFARINTKRFFRNRVAIFFGVLFPIIILFVIGGIFSGGGNVSFDVALINQSSTTQAAKVVGQLEANPSVFRLSKTVHTLAAAQAAMARGTLDAVIFIQPTFGRTAAGSSTPAGALTVYYPYTNAQEARALASVLTGELQALNATYVPVRAPFTVRTEQSGTRGLTSFDYTFAGLLGFALLGIGIFGPTSVFPELKRQGVLRRLETTPLTVWQYFIATAISQCIVGFVTIIAMFAAAILVFKLQVAGNWLALFVFLTISIATILGIGLAIGGWAKDQSQAAPLANIVTFPMLFLSGTFFPRYLMPSWLQTVSAYFPLTPAIDGVRMIAVEGKSLVGVAPQLGLLFAWSLVIYVVAFRVFRWT